MNPTFDTVTIVGVGLLGGSIGLALKERGQASTIRGVGHREETLRKAKQIGAVDETFTDVQVAATGADLIVVCTPAAIVSEYLDAIRPVCGKNAIVTDVASTKADICRHARAAWSEPYRFIGSHPMAGSEQYGPENARADLFVGATCMVERADGHDPQAHGAVVKFWEDLGSRVLELDSDLHDAIVAKTSHVPHVVATALAQLVGGAGDLLPFIGAGFKDTTRVAEGRPEIWRDVCSTNKEHVLENLRRVLELLEGAADALEAGDTQALQDYFRKGQEARRSVCDE